jgi:hypothetical protein
MKAFLAVLIALALVPAVAYAKEGVELSSLPNFLSAGDSWDVNIHPMSFPGEPDLPKSARPAIQITNEANGQARRFPARPLGDGGYQVHVVFPTAGRWDYKVVGIGHLHQQNWAPVDISPAAAPPATASQTDSESFPWPWIAGAGGALVIALGAVGLRRRFRAGAA